MHLVKWRKSARDELLEIWLASPDRNAVTAASDAVEKMLAFAPLRYGESRASSVQRILHYGPLYVEYDVIEDDKKVIVRAVGSWGQS